VLLTAVVLVSSMTATSAAGNASTSRRMSTAPLPARQVLQAGDERQAQTFAPGDHRRRVGRLRADQSVGYRLQPHDLCRGGNRGSVPESGSGPPRPDGSTRRLRWVNALRQALVAIR
jgi:hypothetical protein